MALVIFGEGPRGGGAGGSGLGAIGVSTGGNSLGTSGTVSGQYIFAGGNNITVSQSLNGQSATLTIIGAAAGTAGGVGLSAGTQSIATGTVAFLNSNGISFGMSNSNQVTASYTVPTQSVQTQNIHNVTLSGNTSGILALISSGTWTLAGGNNITLSQAGNAVTISGPTGGGIGVSTGGNTLGTTGTVGQQYVLVGGSNITLSQSVTSGSATVTVIGPTQSAQTGISGIAGSAASTVTVGTVQFANSNGISFGLNGSTMTASYTVPSQTAQTGISGIAGSAASTVTAGTVQFQNSNGISFGLNGSTMTASYTVPSQSIQTWNVLSASGNTSGTLTSFTTGTMVIVGGNNITLSQSSNSITISGANIGGAQTGISALSAGTTMATSGTVSFADSNGITWGINGNTLTASVNPSGGGMALSAGTQSVSTGTVVFSNSNGISFGMSGSNQITASYTVPTQSVQTQNLIDLTLAGNTSGTLALVSSGTLTLAGGNNITLSQVGNAVTISGPSGGGVGVSTGGNTLGTTGTVGQRYVLVGGNNITLSQSVTSGSATVTISAANQSVQTQNMIALSATNTLYSSGTVVLTGSNMITVKSSGAGQTIILDATQSVQTQNLVDVSLSGNTSGTLTLVSSGTLILAGGNNITLSQNGQSITISGANVGGAQTGISGIANSQTTYTSGTVSLSELGAITIRSTTGQIYQFSVNAQTVESQSIGMSNLGNTSGTTGMASGGQVFYAFAGSNNITLSQSLNGASGTLTISGPTLVPIATAVKGVSSIGSTGTVTRYAPEDHQHAGVFSIGISSGGNTAGTTAVLPGQYVLAGGNNITLSQSSAAGNLMTLTISGPTLTSPVVSNAIQDVSTATNSGTGVTQFAAHDHVHRGLRAFDVQGVASTFFGNFEMSAGSLLALSTAGNTTAGTVVFHNLLSSATTVSSVSSANVIGAMASRFALEGHQHAGVGPAGVSNLGNTAGSTGVFQGQLVFVGSDNISLSQSTDASNRMTVTWRGVTSASLVPGDLVSSVTSSNISGTQNSFFARADHQHAGVGPAGVSTMGNTSGSTAVLQGQLVFAGGANVTLSQSTDASNRMTITISAGSAAASPVNFSAGTTSNNLGSVVFSNSNGISFGLNGSTITASGAGGFQSAGISTQGNTSGTTGFASSQLQLVGSNNITLSQSINAGIATITISGPTGGGAGMSTQGNTSGTTGTVGAQLVLVGGNNITLSQSTAAGGSGTLTISALNPVSVSLWPDILPGSTAVSTYYSGSTSQGAAGASTQTGYTFSIYLMPFVLQAALVYSNLKMILSNQTSAASTGTVTHVYSAGIYSNNASTLSKVVEYCGGQFFTQNSATAQTYSVWTASTAGATTGVGGFAGLSVATIQSSQGNISAASQNVGAKGVRIDNGVQTTLTGGQYYFGFAMATVSSGGNVYSNVGVMQSNAISSTPILEMGINSSATANSLPGWGVISTTYTSQSSAATWFGMPNAIALSNMTSSSSNAFRFHFPIMRGL